MLRVRVFPDSGRPSRSLSITFFLLSLKNTNTHKTHLIFYFSPFCILLSLFTPIILFISLSLYLSYICRLFFSPIFVKTSLSLSVYLSHSVICPKLVACQMPSQSKLKKNRLRSIFLFLFLSMKS
jgi:hypothetical protein